MTLYRYANIYYNFTRVLELYMSVQVWYFLLKGKVIYDSWIQVGKWQD